MTKQKKQLAADELQQQIDELTQDLQRTRADFENYRKRSDTEKTQAMIRGEEKAIMQLLPIIDTIDRATQHVPTELKNNAWVQGVVGLEKNLQKMMKELQLEKISAEVDAEFDPELHYAVQIDEDAEGGAEVIAEELQAGYQRSGSILRHAMVKVTRK